MDENGSKLLYVIVSQGASELGVAGGASRAPVPGSADTRTARWVAVMGSEAG